MINSSQKIFLWTTADTVRIKKYPQLGEGIFLLAGNPGQENVCPPSYPPWVDGGRSIATTSERGNLSFSAQYITEPMTL